MASVDTWGRAGQVGVTDVGHGRTRALVGGRALRAGGLLAVVLVVFSIPLLAPRPPEPTWYCGRYEEVVAHRGFVVICDELQFIDEFRRPTLVLRRHDMRQSRPLFVVAGTISGLLLTPVAKVLGVGDYETYRWGARALNAALLVVAVALTWSLLRRAGVGVEIRVAAVAIVAVNDLTKLFMWTAHNQLLNIVVPLAVIAIGMYLLRDEPVGTAKLVGIAGTAGITVLATGLSVMALPIMIFCWLVAQRRSGAVKLGHDAMVVLAATAAFAAPVVAWVAFVRLRVGSFYSAETAKYRQFVWVSDALESGPSGLVRAVGDNAGSFLDTVASADVLAVLLTAAVVVGILLISRRRRPGGVPGPARDLVLVASATTLGCALFVAVLGYYQNRLTFVIVPPLVVLAATLLERVRQRGPLIASVVAVGTVAWTLSHVLRAGPYL